MNLSKLSYYQNPIAACDFSDPDAIRVGSDYYMIASSFTYIPGVPVLHSRDLIHWTRIGYCADRLPYERYDRPAHGCGTWAPSLRYHNGIFYAFIPMPDEGIFVTSAENPAGKWAPLQCIKEASGWIDPCPLWDEDGNVYMAHAFANSRCGIKHRIQISKLDPETLMVTEDGPVVFDGLQTQPTAEGPKMYKRNGWYYIFIPAGGVTYGWQTVLRSRNIYGPYEEKIVLHQGNTEINGPHQGAWVDTIEGSDWFLHFQDAGAIGRILHLQPMCWREDWPFIGQEQNGDEIGEPVAEWPCPIQKPEESEEKEKTSLQISDDFLNGKPGLQWQWQANPKQDWIVSEKTEGTADSGLLLSVLPQAPSLWQQPNILSQMIPGPDFQADVFLKLVDGRIGDRAGIGVLGLSYSFLELLKTESGYLVQTGHGTAEDKQPTAPAKEEIDTQQEIPINQETAFTGVKLSLCVKDGTKVRYSVNDQAVGIEYPVTCAVWTGARLALYARAEAISDPHPAQAVFQNFHAAAETL